MIGKKRGFTILELLAVMAIVAILAGLGAKGYRLARRQAKEGQAAAEIEILRNALNEYRVEYGRYPDQSAPASLANVTEITQLTNLVEGVMLIDPWGNDYFYSCTNRYLYNIWSSGQDGATGTGDDIGSNTGY